MDAGWLVALLAEGKNEQASWDRRNLFDSQIKV
jgi:hypothetical protein